MSKYVVVFSGGMDSTVLLYDLFDLVGGHENPELLTAVSFNYGQRHKKELEFAKRTTKELGLKHHIIDLWSSGYTDAIASSGSSLVSDTEVPDGHYAEDTMKTTVVPNRNMVMLAIAGSIAVAENANFVATAVHSGDHFIYPDCRPSFVSAMNVALHEGNRDFGSLDSSPILAPFIYKTKEEIAYRGLELGVPFENTWSCYKGDAKHCGTCGTCVERLEAIHLAAEKFNYAMYHEDGISPFDATEYEDTKFWKEVADVRN